MYKICKTLEISASHQLSTSYDTPCNRLHGHNWVISVFCRAEKLDENGMVIDFSLVKRVVKDRLDHQNLNDVLPFNPTAENIAHWIASQFPQCYKVEVRESSNNWASFEKD